MDIVRDRTTEEERLSEQGAGCGVCALKPNAEDIFGFHYYDFRYLCLPALPWSKGGVAPPVFIHKDAKLPLMLSLIMGFQHCLAMLAGIATSGGLLIAGDACFAFSYDSEMCEAQAYMVSAAWITSGILTCTQVFRAKIRGTKYYLGTGLISVMGTSFTFLPIAREMVTASIGDAKQAGLCEVNDAGIEDCRGFGMKGFGEFLGTCMVASMLEVGISFLPSRIMQKLFPPLVTGASVMLIGGGLISSGIKYIGGGVFCGENQASREASFGSGPQLCTENGEVVLAFGAPQYVGLGFSVLAMAILLQFFGSPFLKSTFIFWALIFGCFVSALTKYEAEEGDFTTCQAEPDLPCISGLAQAVPGKEYIYWDNVGINNADAITFLWTTTFPLGFAPEYFLPILIAYFVSAAETAGDIACSCVASHVPASGADFDSRVQGGLLADGINSCIACLFTSPPNTTFSQNNGIISLTRCASRSAGFACAFWLILFGVLGKFGGAFISIPICVVGGMVLMCFTMVFIAGMKLTCSALSRRNSFILMMALGIGLGVAFEPQLFVAGGGFAFYSQNLAFLYGFWPGDSVCSVFPTEDVMSDPNCTLNNVTWTSEDEDFSSVCARLGGAFIESVVTGSQEVKTCTDNNGNCCVEYDSGPRSLRTTVLIMLQTPYCVGFLIAMALNLTMPQDKDDIPAAPESPAIEKNARAAAEDAKEMPGVVTTSA